MGAYLGVVAPSGPVANRRWTPPSLVPVPPRDGAGQDTGSKASEKQSAKATATTRSQMETGVSKTGPVSQRAPEKKVRNLCGLEDESDLEDWEPTRITTCQLSPEKQAKFRKLLDLIFCENTLLGLRNVFDPDDIMDVMQSVIPYLDSEPVLIEDVPFDITIVGDLHGQLYDLDRIFMHYGKDGKPGWECRKFLFLGDYVDRGRQSLEIVMALFIIKMLHPDRIWLLRGNHEFIAINQYEGFLEEINIRYHFESPAWILFCQVNATFCHLSIAAIVGNAYLCLHGGVGGGDFTRRAMRGIYKPYFNAGDDMMVNDALWADPAMGMQGSSYNAGRSTSHFFGLDVLVIAMAQMEVKGVFRGHTVLAEGFESSWECIHSLFSATDNCFDGNKGAVAELDPVGKLRFMQMDIDPDRKIWEEALRELSCEDRKPEELTQVDNKDEKEEVDAKE